MNEKSKFNTPIEKRLENWEVSVSTDPQIRQHVLRRIAVAQAEKNRKGFDLGILDWIHNNRLAVASFSCAALLFIGSAVLFVHERRLSEQFALESQSYFLMINPVAHAKLVSDAAPSADEKPSTVDMLAWMKDRFHLSREQFGQLVTLHEEYNDRLMTLYRELSSVESEYATYESHRQNDEAIDFMALYDLLQKRDSLRKDSNETSKQLVELVLRVLTPAQKREYMALLNTSLSHSTNTPESPNSHAGA